MKLSSISSAFLILVCAAANGAAQEPAVVNDFSASNKSADKIAQSQKPALSPELKAKTIQFLRATGREAQSLNLPQNRIRYQADVADLLWEHDEKAARDLYSSAITDFRAVLSELDALQQRTEAGEEPDDDSFFGIFGGGGWAQFYAAQTVRRNLLLAIAKHDAALALDTLRETARPNFENWRGDNGFEAQIIAQAAASDPTRALQIAEQKLERNEFDGLSDVAVKVFGKDRERGARFARDLTRKLRATNQNNDGAWTTAQSLLVSGASFAASDKGAFLNDADLRELAETVARNFAESKRRYNYIDFDGQNREAFEAIKKYAPAAAARLEKDAPQFSNSNSMTSNRGSRRTAVAANAVANVANANVAVVSNVAVASNVNSNVSLAAQRRQEAQQRQTEAVAKLTAMGADPNAKFSIGEARQQLAIVRSRMQKTFALTQLAKALAQRGEKDAAKDLLAEADNLQIAQPRKAVEMLQNLLLADAYTYTEPDRAFTIAENTIAEFNTVSASFARLGDFLGAREIADNGEFNMGGLPRDFTQINDAGFGLDRTMRNLAEADFARTAALADKFDKPELRLEARMLVARLLLPQEETNK